MLYVIASSGHCVINGLGQVKVYDSQELADEMLANMTANGANTAGFTVQAVHLIKEEGGE
jgi:hypothetical protein